MRTTLNLENDAFATAQACAKARAIKFGQAVSELIRGSSVEQMPFKQTGGVWVFDLPVDMPTATHAQVKELLEEGT